LRQPVPRAEPGGPTDAVSTMLGRQFRCHCQLMPWEVAPGLTIAAAAAAESGIIAGAPTKALSLLPGEPTRWHKSAAGAMVLLEAVHPQTAAVRYMRGSD
jgi:hypothetical protein